MDNDSLEIQSLQLLVEQARLDLALYQSTHGTPKLAYESSLAGLGQFRLLNHDYRDYLAKPRG
jgi:hypothetical protein